MSIVSAMYIHEEYTMHLQVGIQREKLKGQPLQVMGIYTIYDSARERSSESTMERRTRENKGREQWKKTIRTKTMGNDGR